MSKPSPELLERVEEFYGTLMAWTHFNVAKFAEQIVRECTEIAKHELAFTTKTSDVTSAILHKFGLKE